MFQTTAEHRWIPSLPRDFTLPLGAVTVISVGDGDHGGQWPALVEMLVHAFVRSGQPVAYTQCGGFDTACTDSLNEDLDAALFTGIIDRDITVIAPRKATPGDPDSLRL